MTTFVSIAIIDGLAISARRLVEQSLMHLLDRNLPVDRTQRPEDVLDPRRAGLGRGTQQDALRPLFDDQFCAGAKPRLSRIGFGRTTCPLVETWS